jgi:hypothetical protein
MSVKRANIYFEEDLHKALRLKASETDTSISGLVNAAVRYALAEDTDDLTAFRERAKERTLLFEDWVRDMQKRGYL